MPSNNSCNYSPISHNVMVGSTNGSISNILPTTNIGVPLISGGIAANPSFGTAVVLGGGTGVTNVTTVPTASSFAGWDANKNFSANNLINGYTTSATAAGTTTLTVSSTQLQYFTGTTTQTVVLPVTSTLALGQQFTIVNNSTGIVTVQSSGLNTIQAMVAGSMSIFEVILTSGTTAASWFNVYRSQIVSAKVIVQTFLASGTYTPSFGMIYCTVELVGGGGGSGGVGATSGTSVAISTGGGGGGYCRKTFSAAAIGASQAVVIGAGGTAGAASGVGNGGTGGNSTFSTLVANGGLGGRGAAAASGIQGTLGVAGGTATGGDVNVVGMSSTSGQISNFGSTTQCAVTDSQGGNSLLGIGGGRLFATSRPPTGYGSAPGGNFSTVVNSSNSTAPGLAGTAGICIVTEYTQ
jgi:hypothetical protein